MKTKQISIFLEHSKKELQRYNSTKKVIHLQQMGEKIWNAFNYLLERISNKEIWTHAQIYTTAHNLKDKDIDELGQRADYLHKFFYEGSGDDFYIKKSYYEAIKLFKKIIKKYKI